MTQKRKIQPKAKKKPTAAKNRRIDISIAKTVNLGDYESLKIQCGLSQDIVDTADMQVVYQDMFDEVASELMDKIAQSTEGNA